MIKALRIGRLPLFVVGLILFFVAERYLYAEAYHLILQIISAVLLMVSIGTPWILGKASKNNQLDEEAKSYFALGSYQLAVGGALLFYLAYQATLGTNGNLETFGQKILLAVYLVLLVVGLISGIGAEFAFKECGEGNLAESKKVQRSMLSWCSIGLLLAGLVGFNYAAAKKDIVSDWSYLKTTTPSASSKAMLVSLDKEVEIALFYPVTNEVKVQVSQYFDAMEGISSKVSINYYDKDLNPQAAEDFKVSRNGQVVLSMGTKRARIDTGLELTKARKSLATLDAEFQKAFYDVTADRKTAYFTRGHGEMSWLGSSGKDPLRSLKTIEGYLRQQNISIKQFGVSEGSAEMVPDDASVVIIAGPKSPFQTAEINAIRDYLNKGGSVITFFDLNANLSETKVEASDWPLRAFYSELGIGFVGEMLANDREYVSATKSQRDKWFIHTNVFTSHPSVVSLSKHEERVALILFESGYLNIKNNSADWKATETVKSLSSTFVDLNRDFTLNTGKETRSARVVGAVSEKKIEGNPDRTSSKVVAFSDATFLSDAVIRNPGNLLYFADSLKWAAGQAEFAGAISSEEDVRIVHTSKEDAIWFNGTVFAMPLLVIGFGFFATRKKKTKIEKS